VETCQARARTAEPREVRLAAAVGSYMERRNFTSNVVATCGGVSRHCIRELQVCLELAGGR